MRVRAKVLDGYEPASDKWRRIFQTSLSRDNLWISKQEHEALVGGTVPASLCERIARFHLVDNTRGEPPMWKHDEIRQLDVRLQHGRRGSVHLETKDGTRRHKAELLGTMETENSRISRFDVVALGQFSGRRSYTRGAPRKNFPLAVGFALADGTDVADSNPTAGVSRLASRIPSVSKNRSRK